MPSPLRHRLFFFAWATNLISNCGWQIQTVGAAWLMTTMTKSPLPVALVTSATSLPILLFSLPFGAISDLVERSRVLFAAQILMLLASAILAVLAFAEILGPTLLIVLSFVLGCGFALNRPAWQVSVGDLVAEAEIPKAVSLNILGFNLARTVAPVLGGYILATWGAAAAFAINAVSYVPFLSTLPFWRRSHAGNRCRSENLVAAIEAGIRYAMYAESPRRIIVRSAGYGVCLSSVMALLPLVVTHMLVDSSKTYGVLLGCLGFGAVLGVLLTVPLRLRLKFETIIRGAHLVTVGGLAAVSISRSAALSGAALVFIGAAMTLSLSSFNIAIQLAVPRWVVGRCLSIYHMGTFGGMAIGAWLWGLVAEIAGVPNAVGMSSAFLLLLFLANLRWPVGAADPARLPSKRRPRDLASIPEGESAAFVEEIYRVDEARRLEFLRLMGARRRFRFKHGACQWSLAQLGGDAELWLERYRSAAADKGSRDLRQTAEEEILLQRLGAIREGKQHGQPGSMHADVANTSPSGR